MLLPGITLLLTAEIKWQVSNDLEHEVVSFFSRRRYFHLRQKSDRKQRTLSQDYSFFTAF